MFFDSLYHSNSRHDAPVHFCSLWRWRDKTSVGPLPAFIWVQLCSGLMAASHWLNTTVGTFELTSRQPSNSANSSWFKILRHFILKHHKKVRVGHTYKEPPAHCLIYLQCFTSKSIRQMVCDKRSSIISGGSNPPANHILQPLNMVKLQEVIYNTESEHYKIT